MGCLRASLMGTLGAPTTLQPAPRQPGGPGAPGLASGDTALSFCKWLSSERQTAGKATMAPTSSGSSSTPGRWGSSRKATRDHQDLQAQHLGELAQSPGKLSAQMTAETRDFRPPGRKAASRATAGPMEPGCSMTVSHTRRGCTRTAGGTDLQQSWFHRLTSKMIFSLSYTL